MTERIDPRLPGASRLQSLSILAVAVALPVLSYPLAWDSDLPHRFELQLPIAVIYLIAVLGILVWQLRQGESLQSFRIDRALLAVLGVGAISTMLSSNVYFSISALVLLLANVALLYATSTWFDLRYTRSILALWLTSATAEAVYGLWLKAHHDFPVGTLGNKDWLAGYLAASLLVCLPLWLSGKPRRLQWVPVGACYLILIVTLAVCHSAGAWLGLGVAALLMVVRLLWTKRRLAALLVAGAVILTSAAVALAQFHRLEQFWHVNVRPPIWKGVIAMVGDSPLIGSGLGTFTYNYASYRPPEYYARPQATNLTDHAHNEFLEIAAESGLFGLGVMLWLIGQVIVSGWRKSSPSGSDRWLMWAAWGGVIALLVHNQFDINLRRPPNQSLWWLLMGLVLRGTRGAVPEPIEPSTTKKSQSGATRKASAPQESSVWVSQKLGRQCTAGACVILIGLLAWSHVYQPLVANLAYRDALIARDRENWGKAIEFYQSCLDRDPYRVEALYRLGYLYHHLADVFHAKGPEYWAQADTYADLSIDQYQRIAELAPDYGDVNTNLAGLYLERDRKRDAIPYLRRAVELNPYNLNLRLTLSHLYLDLGLRRELKNETVEILRLDHTNAWAQEIWETHFKQEKLEPTNAPPRPRMPKQVHPVPHPGR